MDLLDALQRTYDRTDVVIAGLRDDDMARPTPCTDWTVRALLEHMVNAIAQFPAILRDEPPDWAGVPPLVDRTGEFRAAVAANLEAWRAPGAIEKPANLLPGMRVFDLNIGDALVHTWDLGRATGQDPDFDPEVVRVVYDIWSTAPLETSRKYGAFGPEVDVAPAAPLIDRLVGLLGRQP